MYRRSSAMPQVKMCRHAKSRPSQDGNQAVSPALRGSENELEGLQVVGLSNESPTLGVQWRTLAFKATDNRPLVYRRRAAQHASQGHANTEIHETASTRHNSSNLNSFPAECLNMKSCTIHIPVSGRNTVPGARLAPRRLLLDCPVVELPCILKMTIQLMLRYAPHRLPG